jgi:hypothetical protein
MRGSRSWQFPATSTSAWWRFTVVFGYNDSVSIDDESTPYISTLILQNKTLKVISLGTNFMVGKYAKQILMDMQKNTNIERLTLSGNALKNEAKIILKGVNRIIT